MALYCGIDLHASNSYVVVLDEADRVVVGKRLPNDLGRIEAELAPYREELVGVAVESTFNWYWLVDGLMEAGYRLHLVNTTAVQQYSGLKFRDDRYDARWLAHLLRLGLLPTGYIYPRQDRAVRDLLRKRAHLVRQRTANYLSLHNLWIRNTGQRLRGHRLKGLGMAEIRWQCCRSWSSRSTGSSGRCSSGRGATRASSGSWGSVGWARFWP
jgi:transposase